jgi:hypothetical protein
MRRLRTAGAMLALAGLIGCGGGGEDAARNPAATGPAYTEPVDVNPVGISRAGSVAQFADCGDWKGATREQRLATIADIRGQHTNQQSKTAASPLSDEDAYETFQEACSPEWADSLRLYKMYVKFQAFAPLRP